MKSSNSALLEDRSPTDLTPVERPSSFRYLGELQAWVGSRPVEIRGTTQRTLMSALLVAGGHPISVHALTEELWGSAPPCTTGNSLQAHISRLRRKFDKVGGYQVRFAGSRPVIN